MLERAGCVCLFVVAVAAVWCPAVAAEQTPAKRRYHTTHVSTPPTIDGRFDDVGWDDDRWSRGFLQREPHEGLAPTEETAFQIVHDDEYLYVAIRAHDSEPSSIERRVTRRDDRQGDQVEVFVDSYFDHRTAFVFNVSSAGVKSDYVLSRDGADQNDSWDAVWHARVSLDQGGWSAELAIPFSQLRFADVDAPIWGVQVRRRLHRAEELSEWQPIPRTASGLVNGFGELHGLRGISAKRQVELIPYGVAKAERFEANVDNPFSTGARSDLSGGLDGRFAVTSDLMLTFTVNPDFGQVEADPSEVNLTTFETFFEERRPFFIEGRSILDFPISGEGGRTNLFYSRRVGRPPQRQPELSDNEYEQTPARASILGAFKLTGKTRNGWSIGVLDSLTSAEHAEIDSGGQRRREPVEPFTNYFVSRVQKDLNEGRTLFGSMLTATNREVASADLGELHRGAITGGVDLAHNWHDREYALRAKAIFSHVEGSPETITRTQESSRRYYQRPDQDYVFVDESLTSLRGHGGAVSIGKEGGGHLRFGGDLSWFSPGLELNDVGFLRRADRIAQRATIGWRLFEPFSIFRRFNLNVNQDRRWDFGGTNVAGSIGVNGEFQLQNYWTVFSGLFREHANVVHQMLRGGPSVTLPGGTGQWINVDSDRRRAFAFNFGSFSWWGTEGQARNYWVGATYRPMDALSVSVGPFVSTLDRQLQYVDTVELSSTVTRYVLGRLDQTTVGLTIRLNYSVTPDLSIQFYGQPFVSSGGYDRFKRISEPGAEVYEDRFTLYETEEVSYLEEDDLYEVNESSGASFTFSNPSFDFRQFRANLVVRWEYQPGAALFVVWSQDRTREGDEGRFAFRQGLRDLFDEHPFNIFLVKFTYRFEL